MSREHFNAEWLSLREPVDHRSRAAALVPLLTTGSGSARPLRVLDLGAGTGSNLRYLGPRIEASQTWTLVDHDQHLLQRFDASKRPDRVEQVARVQADLSDLASLDIGESDVVTGSALLDLVSKDWLMRLVDACRLGSCRVLFALTYDGSMRWRHTGGSSEGEDEVDDELVRQLVNRHQRGDKGFGPALGPMAGPMAQILFQRRGYRTWLVPSPWQLTRAETELARWLLQGWESVASSAEVSEEQADRVGAWATRRLHAIANGELELSVGHVDFLAMPA